MTLTNKMQTLSASLTDAARAAADDAARAADARIELARAYDARIAALPESEIPRPLPNFVHPHKYSHTCTVGSIWFEDHPADICMQVMRDFPPVPLFYARSATKRQSGFYVAQDIKPDFDSRTELDGFYMSASRYETRSEIAIVWTSELRPGYFVQFKIRLSGPYDLIPGIRGRIVEAAGHIHRIEDQSLYFPFSAGFTLRSFAYAAHKPDTWKDFRAYGPTGAGVLAFVQCIAEELDRRKVETWRAYMADKESAHLRAEPARESRARLRAGSAAQTAALATDAALADRGLAEKHWRAYVRDSAQDAWPVKSSQGYFDYYAWACKYLQSVGLYEDPALLNAAGKPYKYGSAWL